MADDPMSDDPAVPAGPTVTGGGGPVSLSGLTLADAQDQGLVAATSPADLAVPSKGTPVAVVRESPTDRTRQRLAFILLGALLVIVAVEMALSAMFAASCWNGADCTANIEPAMRVMSGAVQPLFTAMVGLVGSVIGFYFGSKTS